MVVLVPDEVLGEVWRTCSNEGCEALGIVSPVPERTSFYKHYGAYRGRCRRCYGIARSEQGRRKADRDKRRGKEAVVNLPLGPFVDLLDEMAAAEPWNVARFRVARRFQIDAKVLDRWRAKLAKNPKATIAEKFADRHLTNEGSRSVAELWPDGTDTRWTPSVRVAASRAVAAERAAQCATPGCKAPHNGGRFCHDCGEKLARVRAEYQDDGALMSSNGGAQRRKSRVKEAKIPVCTRIGCWEPRRPGEDLCEDCQVVYGDEESEE